jgi:hypothetical protein
MSFVSVAANAGATSLGTGANGISRTVTAAASGVTVNLLAAKDASNPTLYQTAGVNLCGSGVAAYSATSGNLFELYTVPGTVLTMVADGTITAGHLLTGGASTAGRVADTGQTARTSVASNICIVGVALASATVGNTVLVAYDGTEAYGAGAASSVAWNAITNPTGNQALTMGTNTTLWTWTSGTTAFGIANAGGTILNVDATNGRVGINAGCAGCITPSSALWVVGPNNSDVLTFSSTTGTGASTLAFVNGSGSSYLFRIGSQASTGESWLDSFAGWHFGTNNPVFGTNERMTILAGGNVGIGNINPGQKLAVTGNATFTAFASPTVLTSALQTCTASTGTPWRASVSDATAPAIGVALTGGGALFANVHCSLTTGTYIVDGI